MQYIDGSNRSFISTNDLSAATNQYLIVKADASNVGQVVLATAATDVILGVLMNTPKAGDNAVVRLRSTVGTLPVLAGGTVAIGDAITANASSKGITTVTAGNQILGYALRAAVTGDILEVMPSSAKV